MRQKTKDIIAFLVCLAILLVIVLFLQGPVWLKIGVGFSIPSLFFVLYMVFRKSDRDVFLEENLYNAIRNAQQIKELSGKTSSNRGILLRIADEIFTLSSRCLRREYSFLATEVKRIFRVSQSVLQIATGLSEDLRIGDQTGSPADTREILDESLETLNQLGINIDTSQAKRFASAKEELRFLDNLVQTNSNTKDAAELLKQILEEKKE